MSPLKKGQKLTDNPKNVRLDLRLTKTEAEDLQYCADKLNTSRTDVINRGVKKNKRGNRKTVKRGNRKIDGHTITRSHTHQKEYA